MPKLGRRNESQQLDYMFNPTQSKVTTDAPFGTWDTPQTRLKIIGGKPVYVHEDNNYGSPRWTEAPDGQTQRARNQAAASPVVLTSLAEKPTNFDPHGFTKAARNYNTTVEDKSKNDLHINPHRVVPPIGSSPSTPGRLHDDVQAPLMLQTEDSTLSRHLPHDGNYLPKQPINLTTTEEFELHNRIRKDLSDFDIRKLKDLYLELAGFDQRLSGYCSYSDLGFALLRHHANISPENLRLVASLFLLPSDKIQINYEKVLSFVSSSLQSKHGNLNSQVAQEMVPPTDTSHHTKGDAPSPRSKKFPYGTGDNAMILRLIEKAILESDEELDFTKIYSTFQQADRGHRGMLSREQIKSLAYSCRIPLQESVMNRVIDKLDCSNGQYSWSQFLEFIEKVYPSGTSLQIPESRKPVEFAKHYPQPSTDWPRTRDDLPLSKPPTRDPAASRGPVSNHLPAVSGNQQSQAQQGQQHRDDQYRNAIKQKEKELQLLEREYELNKHQAKIKQEQEPWFERFMKLAQAIYSNDPDSNGYLPSKDLLWLVQSYNTMHDLQLPEHLIHEAVTKTMDSPDRVPIDSFLKFLSKYQPEK